MFRFDLLDYTSYSGIGFFLLTGTRLRKELEKGNKNNEKHRRKVMSQSFPPFSSFPEINKKKKVEIKRKAKKKSCEWIYESSTIYISMGGPVSIYHFSSVQQ